MPPMRPGSASEALGHPDAPSAVLDEEDFPTISGRGRRSPVKRRTPLDGGAAMMPVQTRSLAYVRESLPRAWRNRRGEAYPGPSGKGRPEGRYGLVPGVPDVRLRRGSPRRRATHPVRAAAGCSGSANSTGLSSATTPASLLRDPRRKRRHLVLARRLGRIRGYLARLGRGPLADARRRRSRGRHARRDPAHRQAARPHRPSPPTDHGENRGPVARPGGDLRLVDV